MTMKLCRMNINKATNELEVINMIGLAKGGGRARFLAGLVNTQNKAYGLRVAIVFGVTSVF